MSPTAVPAVPALALALALAALGCGSDPGAGDGDAGGPGPCERDDPPAECSAQCTGDVECGAFYYCGGGGTCTADCTPTGGECGDGRDCSDRGRCEDDDGCPDVSVELTPVTPTVVLLIDQSGSMTQDFGDTDRWDAVRDALTDADDGVLPALDDRIIVGATLYTEDRSGTCPDLISVAPALGNAAAITALLEDNEPGDNTPTAEAVVSVTATFPASDNPRILVLATDGDPDTCEDPDSNGDQGPRDASEAAVQAAYAAGITTYVLSVGDDATAAHLERLARAGQGQDLGSGAATPYLANSPAELLAAFGAIVGGATSCEIDVDGQVDLDAAGQGTVVLNGDVLAFETDWRMVDADTIELLDDACRRYLSEAEVSLDAEFPCGSVVEIE